MESYCISIPYLEPFVFLTSAGKVKTIDNVPDLRPCRDDITFVKFRCTIEISTMDCRITNDRKLSFQFYLRLPHHTYDVHVDKYMAMSNPGSTTSITD